LAWTLAALIACATAVYIGRTEGGPANVLFTLAVIGTIAATITLIARRILFATFAVAAPVGLLGTIAHLKRQTTDVTLHAYDVVALLTSWAAIERLWQCYS
jgi:hypothetical protein